MSDESDRLKAAFREIFAEYGITPNEPPPYWDLVDPYMCHLKTGATAEVFDQEFEKIPKPSANLIATHFCQCEILNGGLYQFFSNSTGILAPHAVDGFLEIGLPDVAEMLEMAMAFFPNPYPLERAARNAKLNGYSREHPEQWNPFRETDALLVNRLCSDDGRCAGRYKEAANRYARQQENR